jgi:hypothetical protein
VVLRDAEGRLETLAAEAIDEERPGPSLMPEGLTDSLTRAELVDLVRFLSELGKGDYAVRPARLVRRWETLPADEATARSIGRTGFDAMVRGETPNEAAAVAWQPVYARVDGTLRADDLPAVPARGPAPSRRWARFALEVTQPGAVGLRLTGAEGATAWVDGRAVEVGALDRLELAAGRHVVTLALEPGDLGDGRLSAEVVEVAGSGARVQVVLEP